MVIDAAAHLYELLATIGDREVLQVQILTAHGALVALHLWRCTRHSFCRSCLQSNLGITICVADFDWNSTHSDTRTNVVVMLQSMAVSCFTKACSATQNTC